MSLFLGSLLPVGLLHAEKRHSDPDGCLSCHGLQGLEFIDKQGVRRTASIIKEHYYSSLHGSVPCKDCQRKINDYPHTVEDGYVDCTESCHVEEPSEGERFTHKPVHKEFEKSVHGEGWYKGFAGGNRLEEMEKELNPSCRRCHSNTLYILESQTEKFKESFAHTETECGTCHEGEVWLNQFGGHILRRFIGSRWSKNEANRVCISCHKDRKKMAEVEIEDPETKEKKPASTRFIHAVDTYNKTLHGRLLYAKVEQGASCLECHAPNGLQHEIRHFEDEKASSHVDNLSKTCSQEGCHGYAKSKISAGFTKTDVHDLSMIPLSLLENPLQEQPLIESNWFKSAWPFIGISVFIMLSSLYWQLFAKKAKKIEPIFGGDHFERVMVGRKGKKSSQAKKTRKIAARETVTPTSKGNTGGIKTELDTTATDIVSTIEKKAGDTEIKPAEPPKPAPNPSS
ncbi:MAG: hypothetical protein V3U75_10015 [Methylococcaceae bacterium]